MEYTYKENFIRFMVQNGVLKFGEFTLKSGRIAPYFINTGNYKTGKQLAKLGEYYAACIRENNLVAETLVGPAYKGIPSVVLLEKVGDLLDEKGFLIENIDATIIAQAPKMRPYIDTMRENIAKALKMDVEHVNVKATTEEGLGFTGAGEGISAQAICLLETVANYAYDDQMMQERQCGSCGGCTRKQEEA